VEAAKGTNLFFAIYINDEGNRSYETIPLNIVIERQKQGLPSCPELNDKGQRLLFDLSPNDLVYVPSLEEQENPNSVDFKNLNEEQIKRIYKLVSSSNYQAFFIQSAVSSSIVDKYEFSALNKMERDINDIMIKSVCWKLDINRLGEIKNVFR
jgi:CRISPR-associated endonuclease Csn1